MESNNFDPYVFSKKYIKDVPIFYKNIPWSPCIHIRIVFKTGAFNDPVGKEGISHFLEHLIFNGSSNLQNKKAVIDWSKEYTLNTFNASTWYTRTSFILKILPNDFERVFFELKDLLFNSSFNEKDIEHERAIILQEIWGRYKNKKFLAYTREVLKNIYSGHVHERMSRSLGWPEIVSSITAEDLRDWYKNSFVKNNFFIILVGAVRDEHLEYLNHFLNGIPESSVKENKYGEIGKPIVDRFVKTADEIGQVQEQLKLTISRSMEPLSKEEFEIMSQAISFLRDLLNEKLRIERSLCYNVGVFIELNNAFFEISIAVKTDESKASEVEDIIWDTLNKISNEVYKDRFEDMKILYLKRIKSSEFLSYDVIEYATNQILNINEVKPLNETISDSEKVNYNDVARFIKKVFEKGRVFTEIILPSKTS